MKYLFLVPVSPVRLLQGFCERRKRHCRYWFQAGTSGCFKRAFRSCYGHRECRPPNILEQAGIDNTDMVIAVTDSDETNMLACTIINALYSRPKTIARVRAIEYLKNPALFGPKGIPVDIVISPEQIVMESIRNLIEFPGVCIFLILRVALCGCSQLK